MDDDALRSQAEFGAALLAGSENREQRLLLCDACDRLFVSRIMIADNAVFRLTCPCCGAMLMGRISFPRSLKHPDYPDVPIYPTMLDDLRPVTSPHPVFGKRPNWFKRRFYSADEAYWPTVRDADAYRRHMEEDEHARDVEAIGGRYVDPYFDRRMKVKRYRDQRAGPRRPEPPWWKRIGEEPT